MDKKIIILITIFTLVLSSCSSRGSISQSNKLDTSVSTSIEDNKTVENKKEKVTELSNKNNEEKKEPQKDSESKSKLQNIDLSKFSTAEKNWFFQPKKNNEPSGEPQEIINLINKYSAYYLGDTSKKVLYLTFDEGYENGYTAKILDVLKNNNVTAAFFVTTPYINSNKDLIKRMVDEGHLVCNHSNTHPSMAAVAAKDASKFQNEFYITEKAYEDVTGKKMPKFFRPPMGKYSELSLYYTQKLGYKTIFWSSAYHDWDINNQPSPESAKKTIMDRTHNGGIILLHAVSKTNTELLDSIIKEWKNNGYELQPLSKLP
ncbi:delta-lactam-biosynthetic de-N-acetylase [Clostridium thailandense]|uniref:delta-lactam-biosynthetic de-N-acetylase n=1 Tax=Clostridium thailandense TaxID=2794346 RepID=UPI003989167D